MGKLSDEQKLQVLADIKEGVLSLHHIGLKYGTSGNTIRRIKSGMDSANESAQIVNLPEEPVLGEASPAPTGGGYKSKKVRVKEEAKAIVDLPTEQVEAVAAPALSKHAGRQRQGRGKSKTLRDEPDIEVIELDELPATERFNKVIYDATHEEELLKELEEAPEDEMDNAPPPEWMGEKFKQAKPSELNEPEITDEELRNIMGGDTALAAADEIINESIKPRNARSRAVAEPESDESLALRAKTMTKIHLNVSTFGDHLPWIKNKDKFLADLHKKTTREICDIGTLIETQRSLGNAANQLKHLFYLASQGTEMLTSTYLDLKTQGFAEELQRKDKELSMIFQEIAIDSADTLRAYTSPHARLGMVFASTLFMVDNRNRMVEFKHQMEKKTVNPGMATEYKDI